MYHLKTKKCVLKHIFQVGNWCTFFVVKYVWLFILTDIYSFFFIWPWLECKRVNHLNDAVFAAKNLRAQTRFSRFFHINTICKPHRYYMWYKLYIYILAYTQIYMYMHPNQYVWCGDARQQKRAQKIFALFATQRTQQQRGPRASSSFCIYDRPMCKCTNCKRHCVFI